MKKLNLDMILNFPKKVLRKIKRSSDYPQLLPKDIYEKYDFVKVKRDVSGIFKHFKEIQYLYNYPSLEYNIKVKHTKGSKYNRISNSVEDMDDNQIWLAKFYNSINNVAVKLTMQEAEYFVDAFIENRSEEFISEKIAVSKNNLQNIKKSCLVKLLIEFQELI